MKVDKFVSHIKELIGQRNILIDKKKELTARIRNGRDFFTQATAKQISSSDMAQATKLILDYTSQLIDVDDKILETDIIMTTALEGYLSDFVVRMRASQKNNDAGDNIDLKEFVFAPYKNNDNMIEITPEELWFLKIFKQAVGIRNVEVISKDQYYIK